MNIQVDNVNYLISGVVALLIFATMGLALSKIPEKGNQNSKRSVVGILTALSLMATLRGKLVGLSTTNLATMHEYSKLEANAIPELDQPSKKTGNVKLLSPVSVRFDDICFDYDEEKPPSKRLIQNFSWTLKKGLNTLTSRSGRGKTTIAKLLMGLYEPQSGSIWLNEKKIDHYDLGQARQQIVFINQDLGLLKRTIEETIKYGNDKMSPAKVKTLFDKVRTNFEGKALDYSIGHQAKNLSTGQKQCLRLLNAIGSTASVVVLDEPCSGLDPSCKKTMIDLILEMSKEKVVMVITHDQELKNLESNKKGFELKELFHFQSTF